jgi:hypothetical protein
MRRARTRFATGEVDLDEQLVRQLTERARAEGLKLTGEGLLQRLTKLVVPCSLEGELDGLQDRDPGTEHRDIRRGFR